MRRYDVTLTDADGNAVPLYDSMAQAYTTVLPLPSRYILYGTYDNYPLDFTFTLKAESGTFPTGVYILTVTATDDLENSAVYTRAVSLP